MPDVKDTRGLLLDCVRDLYAAETEAADRYPSLVEAVAGLELKAVVEAHRVRGREHARRLEAIADLLGESVKGPASKWAEGILDDAEHDTRTVAPGPLLDAALIGALRKLEHAEIVSYETAVGVARAMGLAEVVRLLEQTHAEERVMDARLVPLLAQALGGPPELLRFDG